MKNPLAVEIYKKRMVNKEYEIQDVFSRDQAVIINSLPFRRLKHKTAVLNSLNKKHICTRAEHVLDVAKIGATVCNGLNNQGWDLDAKMAYTIGLGHDLGLSPFGLYGASALHRKLNADTPFSHELHNLRVVDKLCNDGKGLNLTYGVRDGIINHTADLVQQSLKPHNEINKIDNSTDYNHLACSYEGIIIKFSNKIASLGRDIEDALVAGLILLKNVPLELRDDAAQTNGTIAYKFINDLISTSKSSDEIAFSNSMYERFIILQDFSKRYIYGHPQVANYYFKGELIIEEIIDYLLSLFDRWGHDDEKYGFSSLALDRHFGAYLKRYKSLYTNESTLSNQVIYDFISAMTDNNVLGAITQIKAPTSLAGKSGKDVHVPLG